MPELPEVQTVVNELSVSTFSGATVARAEVLWEKYVQPNSVEYFCNTLVGCSIDQITRRGKYIVVRLGKSTPAPELFLIGHLRMSGKLSVEPIDTSVALHTHLRILLDNGYSLNVIDPRKFGRWYLTESLQTLDQKLGIEPLSNDFSEDWLAAKLSISNRAIKAWLLDQGNIAGLGNIYVDEALWQAKIHPESKPCLLRPESTNSLHLAILDVLKKGLANLGTTLGTGAANFYSVSRKHGKNQASLQVFRRDGEQCFCCKSIIIKKTIAGRGTHFCPKCQQLIA